MACKHINIKFSTFETSLKFVQIKSWFLALEMYHVESISSRPRLIGPFNVMLPFIPFYTRSVNLSTATFKFFSYLPSTVDGPSSPWMSIPPPRPRPPGFLQAPRPPARASMAVLAHQTSPRRAMQIPVTPPAVAGFPSGGGSDCSAAWCGMCAGERRTTGVIGSTRGITALYQLRCTCISPSA